VGIFVAGPPVGAAPLPTTVSCPTQTCVVQPVGGPVAVDPAGFTLDVDWSPQLMKLLGIQQNDWWSLVFFFTFTGTHDGTEHFGAVTLLDDNGDPVTDVNPQFDDTNIVGSTIEARYQIFNNGADLQTFLVQGLQLGASDGDGVRTLEWTEARFYPAALVDGAVPEPAAMLLLGLGLFGAGAVRRRSL